MALKDSDIIIDTNLERISDKTLAHHIAHVLCYSGELRFSLGIQEFTLQASDTMIIVQPELFKGLHASDDLRLTCIYVGPEFLERCTPRSNYGTKGMFALFANPIMKLSSDEFIRLQADFALIERCFLNTAHRFQEDMLISANQMLFLDYFDIHASQDGLAHISFQDADLMARFVALLEDGAYIKHREVAYYAERLYVTPKYLSEVSKSASGKTANYWITRFAVVHIHRLLQEKSLSFTEITDLFEFSSTAYFSRFVQKHLGAPPSSFRE